MGQGQIDLPLSVEDKERLVSFLVRAGYLDTADYVYRPPTARGGQDRHDLGVLLRTGFGERVRSLYAGTGAPAPVFQSVGGMQEIPLALQRALKRFSNRPCTTWGGCGISARTDAGGPMRAYSMDLRERVLLDSDAGMKAADVAAKYRVSGSCVRLLKQRRRETGEVAPRVQRHGRRPMLEPHLHTLAALIAEHPDRTLVELQDGLGTPASLATIWRAVQALDITVKKNGAAVRARSA